MSTLAEISEKLSRLELMLTPAKPMPRSPEEATAHANGLLSYEDVQDRLTVGLKNPRRPCMRTVRNVVDRYTNIVRPVRIGHTLVGFRPANVEKLISHLSGEGEGRAL